MRYKIRLTLESPLMVGGKKLSNNYNKSLPYIPGGVMAAALSREILKRCSFYNPDQNGNIVEFKDLEGCRNCKVQDLCKNFSKLSFRHFYPFDSKPYPLTNKRCKFYSEHKNVDWLMYYIKKELIDDNNIEVEGVCPNCKERLEKKDGLHRGGKDITLIYSLITKTAIDYYTRKSKDANLYSLDTITTEGYIEENGEKVKKQLEFIGEIKGPISIEAFEEIRELYVGAYTTIGLGKVAVKVEPIIEERDIEKRINNFNNHLNVDNGKVVSLTLKTDAYLNLERFFPDNTSPSDFSTEDYKAIYQKYFTEKLGEKVEIIKVMANHGFRRGFDTKGVKVRLRKSKLVTQAGGIFVIRINNFSEEDMEKLYNLEDSGLGENTQYGFGQVILCDPYHIENKVEIREGV